MAERIITINDVRNAGLCAKGARIWAQSNGFDLRAFLKDGMTESKVAAMNDAMANKVLAHVRAQQQENQQ